MRACAGMSSLVLSRCAAVIGFVRTVRGLHGGGAFRSGASATHGRLVTFGVVGRRTRVPSPPVGLTDRGDAEVRDGIDAHQIAALPPTYSVPRACRELALPTLVLASARYRSTEGCLGVTYRLPRGAGRSEALGAEIP